MAAKNNIAIMEKFRAPGEDIFGVPSALKGFSKPIPLEVNVHNLKPNTRYKVMIDNRPGNDFEDITDFCDPLGDSIEHNTHKAGNRGRWTYFKTSPSGKLNLRIRNYGTDEASITGTTSNGTIDWTDTWKYWNVRSTANDRMRDRIKLIAYNHVLAPDTDAKIKTIKQDVSASVARPSGGLPAFGAPEYSVPDTVICDISPPKNPKTDKPEFSVQKADFYQTFWVSAEKFDGSPTVDITDISLYFRKKSERNSNASGRESPGVNVFLAKCEKDGTPIATSIYKKSRAHLPWAAINPSPSATSESRVTFSSPVTVETDNYYAIGVVVEDKGTVLWQNVKGDYLTIDGKKTEIVSQGSSKGHRGSLYRYNSKKARLAGPGHGSWIENSDLDIKFDVHCAEYDVNSVDVTLVNKPYEFLTLTTADAGWASGELVYKNTADESGTVSISAGKKKITGVGTAFQNINNGQKVVITHETDSTIKQVFTVDRSVGSNSSTTILYVQEAALHTVSGGTLKVSVVGEVEYYDYYNKRLRLRNSSVNHTEYTANNTMAFAASDVVVGVETGTTATVSSIDDLPVSVFRSDWKAQVQPQFKPTTSYNLSYENTPGDYYLGTTDNIFYMNIPNFVREYDGAILSASKEVLQTDIYLANNQYKSAQINLNYQYLGDSTRSYMSPNIDLDQLNMICHRWNINNSNTNEHLNNGSANTRWISKTLKLGNKSAAEDIRVIVNGYRPRTTEIDVYAKIFNNADTEAFDDKHWTKLTFVGGDINPLYSDTENMYDFKEYEYTFPSFPAAASTLTGTFVTEYGNSTIAGVGFDTSEISALSAGDVLRVYSPLFENNYQLYMVNSANSSAGEITFNSPVANVNLQGTGFKVDTLVSNNSAFKNPDNYGIIRYFNEAGAVLDTYNSVAIKVVLRSEERRLVPKIDDIRVIGVTA